MSETSDVIPVGWQVDLSEDRVIFVGYDNAFPESIFIGLYNGKGLVTKMILSAEAGRELSMLLHLPREIVKARGHQFRPPKVNVWQRVAQEARAQALEEEDDAS